MHAETVTYKKRTILMIGSRGRVRYQDQRLCIVHDTNGTRVESIENIGQPRDTE